jgi:hypothetical protein
MPLTAERLAGAMTPAEYMAQMKLNREPFQQVLARVEIPAEVREFFAALPEPLDVAVFTEDFCGDAVLAVPVLFRLAEETGKLRVRVFLRDADPELAAEYLPPEQRGTVPVFVFLAPDGRPLGTLIERAPELYPILAETRRALAAAHPELPDADRELGQMSETTRRVILDGLRRARVEHAREWGALTARAFQRTVASGLASQR